MTPNSPRASVWTYRAMAVSCSALVFVSVLAGLPIAVVQSVIHIETSSHPTDPSAVDTAMWMLVFASPLVVVVTLGVSIMAAVATYGAVMRQLNSN